MGNSEKFPSFIYGTAWKEDATAELVKMAVSNGFSGIDTANQPRHYQEHLVGEALLKLSGEGIEREDLFLQSKFTPADGHDHRIPYNPSADLTTQVKQSFGSSLKIFIRIIWIPISYIVHILIKAWGMRIGRSGVSLKSYTNQGKPDSLVSAM